MSQAQLKLETIDQWEKGDTVTNGHHSFRIMRIKVRPGGIRRYRLQNLRGTIISRHEFSEAEMRSYGYYKKGSDDEKRAEEEKAQKAS